MVIGSLVTSNRWEISLKSKVEKKSMNTGFLSDKIGINKLDIKRFYETLCDVEVHKVKDVDVYKTTEIEGVYTNADFRDVYLNLSYQFNGENINVNKFYLPRVPKRVGLEQVKTELIKLFGSDVKVTGAYGI